MTNGRSPDEVLAGFEALLSDPYTNHSTLGMFAYMHRIRILEALRASGSGKVGAKPFVVADGEARPPAKEG